ncbi:hypothetical protein IV38_GL001622 [Lactobacillus selangorensis]|uniref:Uncharacterized protein n=1 Tax=Lactobacillus selangorensis TaxID=81857 RepID=A0A0R2G0K1_9LACO|nr:hypothetical protein [Lactobacillus selangorensis]KRN28170.1 hypothetical protein IV38_GL001622 [Lactobacillus selangorensis]KRN30954.1 hypothetical protein IV40_GL001593 [Lactobacillus selangorensis]
MSLKQVKKYEQDGHEYDVRVGDDGMVHVAVDGGDPAKGYYMSGTVRFPKAIVIDGKYVMSLQLACNPEIEAALNSMK